MKTDNMDVVVGNPTDALVLGAYCDLRQLTPSTSKGAKRIIDDDRDLLVTSSCGLLEELMADNTKWPLDAFFESYMRISNRMALDSFENLDDAKASLSPLICTAMHCNYPARVIVQAVTKHLFEPIKNPIIQTAVAKRAFKLFWEFQEVQLDTCDGPSCGLKFSSEFLLEVHNGIGLSDETRLFTTRYARYAQEREQNLNYMRFLTKILEPKKRRSKRRQPITISSAASAMA